MADQPRTVIEFADYAGADLCHKTFEVRVNGTPVLLERDGVDIEYGHNKPTVVTLRILPTEVHFNHVKES